MGSRLETILEGSWDLFPFICKAGDFAPSQLLAQPPSPPPSVLPSVSSRGREQPLPCSAWAPAGGRQGPLRQPRGAGRLTRTPFSDTPRPPAERALQMAPTKRQGLVSQPLPHAVPLLAGTWQPTRPSLPSLAPRQSPALSPRSFFFSLSQVVTAQASRKESNTDRSHCSAKRQEKNNQKSRGLKKKARMISQIEWETLTCLIATENKPARTAQASDGHAGVLNRRVTLSKNLPL